MISSKDVEYYRENGYLGVDGVLTTDEVAELRRVTDELVERSRSVRAHTDVFDLEPGHSEREPRVRRIKQPHEQHPVYKHTLCNPRILDIVAKLIGPVIRFQSTKLPSWV